jgi:phospholipase/carboxylesterase
MARAFVVCRPSGSARQPKERMMTPTLTLPSRSGGRPATDRGMPHGQLGEDSPAEIYSALAAWLFALPHVEERRSRMSMPTTRAAWIVEEVELADSYAQREFTHLHQEPGPGSQHLGLRAADADVVLANDWGEPHPINESQEGFEYLLIFAPRDAEELEVVKAIVRCSYEWTIGPVDESEA